MKSDANYEKGLSQEFRLCVKVSKVLQRDKEYKVGGKGNATTRMVANYLEIAKFAIP
jgi:hypothetical protein